MRLFKSSSAGAPGGARPGAYRLIVPCLMLLAVCLMAATGRGVRGVPVVEPNANTQRAGVLRNGVLDVTLEARTTPYYADGPDRPPIMTQAFAEPGKAPLAPGPLMRVPAGTEIRVAVRNSLTLPITFLVPQVARGGPDRLEAMDSMVIAPGATQTLTTRATSPGSYVYRATVPTRTSQTRRIAGVLAGALIVDSARAVPHDRENRDDRVFVIMHLLDSLHGGREVFTINGRSWPNTERIVAAIGDSLRWRVVNASNDIHPMHLHGFYFRVDEYASAFADVRGAPSAGQMVVTQPLPPWSGMSMTWSPDRPGNWLFHCHFAVHTMPDRINAAPDDPHMRAMSGLVVGISVAARRGGRAADVRTAGEPALGRHLRLVALEDSSEKAMQDGAAIPSMHFVLDDGERRIDAGPDFSPELDLVRGEPVAITIVNHMAEPTSVHWHGIEVEDSYVDGVPGFSGAGRHLAPAIAPGDSFVARFTPGRAGTFMYHAHVDDVRQQSAGLAGALIVREPDTAPSPDDHVFFLKSSREEHAGATPVEINGELHPDTVVVRAGHVARFRLVNLTTHHNAAAATFELETSDDGAFAKGATRLVQWEPIAKDGADLPTAARAALPARQVVTIGETFDFEYTPLRPGVLRLQISSTGPQGAGRPLIAVPIRVE